MSCLTMIVPFIATLFCIAVASSTTTDTSLGEFNTCIFNILPDENYTHVEIDTAVKECFELIEDVSRDPASAVDDVKSEAEVTDETLPLPVTSISSNINDINNSAVVVSNPERPCTKVLQEWLEDLREHFADWGDRMYHEDKFNILEQEGTLLQLRFVKKMNDLLVSNDDDVTQRDAISAYVMSLLDYDERYMLLYKLDELEGRMMRINKPFSFDFNNAMSYFLDLSKGLDYHLMDEERLLRAEARTRMNFYIDYLNEIWELPDDDDQAEVFSDMYSQLDYEEKKSLTVELKTLKNELRDKFGEEEDNFSTYNVIIYFQNKAEGLHEEYVSSSVLTDSLHYRFLSLADDAEVDSSDVKPDTVVESNDENTIRRQEAQQILDFYQKVLVAAYDEGGNLDNGMRRIYLDMFTQLDEDDDERSLVGNGMTKVKEILLPLGVDENGLDEYHNWYNIMAYYENIAKGTELEFVASSVLVHNLDMLERFLPHDYDAGEASNSNDIDEDEPLVSRIESALMYKPHPDLDDSWTWDNLSTDMLIDVCDKTLLPLSRPGKYSVHRPP